MNRVSLFGSAVGAIMLASTPAYAQQSLGDLFENFRSTSLGPAADFIGAAAFFGGIVLVLLAIFKLIQNSRNPHDTGSRPITALVMFIAGSLCIALPEFAGVGVTSFLGSGAETSTVDGTLRSIN
jgi:hypothetical protein